LPVFFGIEIKLDDRVYEPAEDTELAMIALSRLLERSVGGLRVLDMGCGTGILGIYAAKSEKTREVVLADISEAAVALARENVSHAGIEKKAKVVRSDLFSNIQGAFDIIVFNAPYLPEDPGESPDVAKMLSGGKEGVELSIRFLEEAQRHLKQNSHVILVSSSFSNQRLLHEAYKRLGYVPEFEIGKHIFFEEITATALRH
jgi:HemK-related putative methylase